MNEFTSRGQKSALLASTPLFWAAVTVVVAGSLLLTVFLSKRELINHIFLILSTTTLLLGLGQTFREIRQQKKTIKELEASREAISRVLIRPNRIELDKRAELSRQLLQILSDIEKELNESPSKE